MGVKIGLPGETPVQAARREGYEVLHVYEDGSLAARRAGQGFLVRLDRRSGAIEVSGLGGSQAVGEFDDSPEQAAIRVGYSIVERSASDGRVLALDPLLKRLYWIHSTGNGPWEEFAGWKDDPPVRKN